MARIVLASQSPSRLGLLRNGGVEPVVHPPEIDEDALIDASLAPADQVLTLARAKSSAVARDYPEDLVIACDSMLLLDGELLGKPHTVEKTIERWHAQAGRTAELLTAHCITHRGDSFEDVVRTSVTFGTPSDADIEAYARSGEPLGCAGAFTLEALGSWFIDSIEGDPSSVIGLSMPLVRRALYHFGLNASDVWQN